MGLEKMGLPPKPYEKGKDWTPDAPNCEGCGATFTFFNRKHHCRRCGGLFCNNCTLSRQYLRGQGDAPARVCEPCKKIEDAVKLERQTKSKTPRGVTKASTKDDGTEALLKHILGSDGKSQGDVDVESILARVADNDSDEHELASPTQENAPVSPARLHEQAQEEKKRYSALKKQGKDADALKAFKRAKELERQAEAREKEIRHQRRISAGSSSQFLGQHSKTSPSREDPELSSFSRKESELGDNLKKRRAASQDQVKEKVPASEKDDFLHDLKALGWSDKEIREAEKKPVPKTEEQLLAELTAEVHPKLGRPATSTAPGAGATMSAQILAHRRQALVFKREGNMIEAKEELRKAKLLEKQAEEMAVLGQGEGDDEASDDDDLVALIRGLEKEEKLKGNAGKGGTSQSIPEDFSLFSSFVDDDGDAHVEVDDDDLHDPEMVAALRAMGWEEEGAGLERKSKIQPKVSKSTQSIEPTLKEQILALKRKALGFKREGKIAEARAALGEAKMLEQQLEKQESLTTPSSTVQTPLQPPAQVSVPALDVNDDKVEESEEVVEVTEEDMHDPEMMAQLRAMGFGDESTSSHETVTIVTKDNSVKKAALNQEILGLKRQALALKREGRTDEAREVLREAKILEQQVQDLQAVSQRQEEASALIMESRAVRRGVQPPLVLSEALSLDDEGEEEDVEVDNADLVDPAIAAALAAMGWQDDPTDQPLELSAIVSKDDEPNRRAAVVSDLVPESLKPVGESQPQKVESMKSDVKAIEPKETEPTYNASAEVLSVPATSNPMYSNKTKSQLQQELLGRKRRALALKREGKSDEARIELQEAKIIEQKIAELDKGPAAIPLTVAEPNPPAASVQHLKQVLESAPPVYFDDLPIDGVEVTDDDMQDPALLAALASVGWQGDAEVRVPSKSAPILKKNSATGEMEPVEGNVKSSGIKAQTGKGVEKLEMVLESDWGVPRKKTGKGTVSKGTSKEKLDSSHNEGETFFEGEYGEIGQTLDLVPPILDHTVPKDSAAPSQQHNFWFMDLLTGDRTKSNASKEQADRVILPPLTQSIPKPPERVLSSLPSAKPAEVPVTKAAVSPQPATLNLPQEILAHKRKALALKREGKAAEAREELRKAKLLEKQMVQHESEPTVLRSALTSAGTGDASARNNAEAVPVSTTVTRAKIEPSIPVKTSSPSKVSDHKGEMQKQVRQTKDRMKLQQESLAHKRKAMGLRREGKIDEADAEYELAKNLEKQMEELDPMHGKDLGDVAGVDDLLDPQLLAALKSVGFKEGELAGASRPKGPVNPLAAVTGQTRCEVGSSSRTSLGGAVAASNVTGGAVEAEKKQLEEQIRAQKLQAVQLKRAGKQGEALEKLRASKLLEKRLLALSS